MNKTNNTILVSILVTAYNCAGLLAKTLDSLTKQSFENIEVIVVEDGSDDVTPQIISAKVEEDSRIKAFFPGRLGRAKALNFGLQQCRGKYVAVNDADDYSYPHRISEQVKFLEENEEYVLVGSRMMLFNNDTGYYIPYTDRRPLKDREIRKYFFKGQPIQHSTVLMRRTSVEEVGGYNENIKFLLDRDIFIRLASLGKLANLEECLIDLGRGDGQFFKSTYKGRERVLLDFYYRLKAAKKFKASYKELFMIYLLKYWSLSPNNFRQIIKKLK